MSLTKISDPLCIKFRPSVVAVGQWPAKAADANDRVNYPMFTSLFDSGASASAEATKWRRCYGVNAWLNQCFAN